MMRFAVLGSGSSGNSALLEHGETRILVDAGFSAKQLMLRLQRLQISPDSIDAILLTHEHGDHISGLDVFLKTRNIPVYTNALTREAFTHKIKRSSPAWHLFENEQKFKIGNVSVKPIPLLHDAADPVGFRFESSEHSIAYLSDLGFASSAVKTALQEVDLAYLEANYDEELLINDTKRPHSTKQRIMGRHGHLSNEQTSSLVSEVCCNRLKHLILGHLSSDCNSVELATAALRRSLSNRELTATLTCSSADEPTQWFQLQSEPSVSAQENICCLEQPEFLF